MAFRITYDGNGSDGGSVPVDTTSYNAGDPVKLPLLPGMTRTGATFAYWNTKENGTGIVHGWPADTSLPMPDGDLTLYAQWFVATGLNNGGATTHYAFSYDESLRASGLEPGRTQTLMANAERDYAIMANWFQGVTLESLPLTVYVTRLGGGANTTREIRLKPGTQGADYLRSVLVSEVTESFMQSQSKGWGYMPGIDNEESCGEALSLFLTQQFALKQGFTNPYTAYTANTASGWLNSSLPEDNRSSTRFQDIGNGSPTDFGSRFDYVNSVRPYPDKWPSTGGSMLFLYYLFRQLGFTINQIIAAAPGYNTNADGTLTLNATAPLRGVYKNLTRDDGDPFPRFKQLLDAAYPEDQVSWIPGDNPDDPWPLPKPGVISGFVTNADWSAPIQGAVVVIDGPSSAGVHSRHLQLTTVPNGSYTTPPLDPGEYTIEASASDYVPVAITVAVSEWIAITRGDVVLPARLPIAVQGTVTDRANAPLAGVTVTLVGEPGPIWQQTTTDSAGAYSLSLDPGQYTGAYGLYAKLAGYGDRYVGLASIPNGATLSEVFVLVAFGTVTGLITDASAPPATPIAGAQVTAGEASATSDATGRYTVQQLTPGPIILTVTANGFDGAGPTTISVPEGAAVTQDFALIQASATLTGTISDAETSSPISGAVVSVTGATARESSSDGMYTVRNIPGGLASITVKARGYDTIQFTEQFAAHQTITQDFVLYAPRPPGPAR
ncbi:MAG TPA: carboxypeptidase regulatory-like domain-containing protein [Rhizomicrobium sp.]|nr:carboxypeptidase regulatory-like domain-containing protein [Rhizomicrobium sp.]